MIYVNIWFSFSSYLCRNRNKSKGFTNFQVKQWMQNRGKSFALDIKHTSDCITYQGSLGKADPHYQQYSYTWDICCCPPGSGEYIWNCRRRKKEVNTAEITETAEGNEDKETLWQSELPVIMVGHTELGRKCWKCKCTIMPQSNQFHTSAFISENV